MAKDIECIPRKTIAYYNGFSIKEYNNNGIMVMIRYFKVVDEKGNVIEKMNNLRAKVTEDYKRIIDEALINTSEIMSKEGLKYI